MNQLIIADREEHSERNNEIFSENLILNFSNYSPAPDLLESLNREKVMKNYDESYAKGLRSVLRGRSRLMNMFNALMVIAIQKVIQPRS